MHKVYIELVFIDNFSINLLILLLAARLSSLKLRWHRIAFAAAAGGIYACAALIFGDILASLPVKAAVALAMCFMGFWTRGEKRFLKSTCAFWAVSFVLAGAIYACMISFGEPSVISGTIVVRPPVRYILLGLAAGTMLTAILARIRRNIRIREDFCVKLRLKFGGRQICVKTFVDTGNLVKEPLSGCEVIFLDRITAGELLGEKLLLLITTNQYEKTDRLRIVPCSTAAGKEIFYGIEIDEAALCDRETGSRAVVCIAKHVLPSGFGAIVGSNMIDALKKGEENEDSLVSQINCMGDAAAGAAGRYRLHKRKRGAPTAAVTTGRDGAAAAAGGGGQVGKEDID